MIAVPQAVDQFGNADLLREALLELTRDPEAAERSARLRAAALAEGW